MAAAMMFVKILFIDFKSHSISYYRVYIKAEWEEKIEFLYYNKLIENKSHVPKKPNKFFQERYVVLAGPFNPSQFYEIRKEQMGLGRDIHSYGLTHNSGAAYCNLFIPTGEMDLTPYGRKIVTKYSSLIMAVITIVGYMNIVR